MTGARLGEVSLVKGCMICRGEVVLIARKDSKKKLPPKGSLLPEVCEKCRKKYLSVGVLLINPKNGKFAVIKDEAFTKMFNIPIPKNKISFTDDKVLTKLMPDKMREGK